MIKPIPEWKRAWRFASVQLSVLGIVLMSLSDTVVGIWGDLPSSIRQDLPHAETVGIIMFVLTIVGRLVTLKEKLDG